MAMIRLFNIILTKEALFLILPAQVPAGRNEEKTIQGAGNMFKRLILGLLILLLIYRGCKKKTRPDES
ncbi:MAG: hypothetical protein CVU54_03415 [Deltaproteobacteria bacterium HGW-Deltaproteobacteria-12]|jgi:hypothetical protein|nr:MAG: hypothetical protein CVU54_03415 [Deltaproteobacteria bacterium HGW-Deltaproteobacteria-12]